MTAAWERKHRSGVGAGVFLVVSALTMLGLGALPTRANAQDCTGPFFENPCAPTGGSSSTDCNAEWIFTPPASEINIMGRGGIPKNRVVCYEGDPRCDFDPDLTNKSCTLRVTPCINNQDPRLPKCNPFAVSSFTVMRPLRPALLSTDDLSRQSLENSMGAGGLGLTIKREIYITIYEGQPTAASNVCGPPAEVIVPLKQRSGKSLRNVKRFVTRTDLLTAGKFDKDSLLFECRPSTCGDGVIQGDHEQCDDGNRDNGDGCDAGCQLEGLAVDSPTPTASRTPTDTPTPLGTPTYTPTQVPGAPTFTPTQTASPSPTPTPIGAIMRRCNFRTGTNNTGLTVQGGVTANASISGFQDWLFLPPDVNNVRQIVMPKTNMSFSCALVQATILITITAGTVCIRPDFENDDGVGVLDCNGGNETGYNTLFEMDHNTNENSVGFPIDPDCEETFLTPDGLLTRARIESPDQDVYHAGVCNSALHSAYSGNYPANGMTLTQNLIARISTAQTSCSPNPCPPQTAPFDGDAGDLAVTGRMTTGQSTAVMFNNNNGASSATRTFTGAPVACSTIFAPTGNVNNMRVGVAIPFPDTAATINDGRVEVRLVCNP
jgi:cysteine-rich repeat protein